MIKQNMDKRNYAFDRTNFTLLAICFAIVVIGFILMSGSSSTEQAFNPDIFSFRRIKVAPVVCFVGFISMIYAIIHKPKDNGDENTPAEAPSNNEEA
jgi:cell division protein FtsW (lipid II flippase)